MTYMSEVRGVVSDAWNVFTNAVEDIHDSEPFQPPGTHTSVFVLFPTGTLLEVVEVVRRELSELQRILHQRFSERNQRRLYLEQLMRQVRSNLNQGRYREASQWLDAFVKSFRSRSFLSPDVQPKLDLLFEAMKELREKARALNHLSTAAQRAARAAPKVARAVRAAAPVVHHAGLAGGRIISEAARAAKPAWIRSMLLLLR